MGIPVRYINYVYFVIDNKKSINNVRKFSYIDAILQNWIRSGYKTVEDIKDKKDTKNPSWLNEKIEEQEMTKEELEELEKDFSKYK